MRQSEITLDCSDIRPLQTILDHAGLNLDDALKQTPVAINPFALADDDKLPLSEYFKLLYVITEQLNDESGHMSERAIMPGSTDFALSQIRQSRTLEEAIQSIANTYNIIHGGHYNHIEIQPNTLTYAIRDDDFPYTFDNEAFRHLTMECVLIFAHAMLSIVSGRSLDGMLRQTVTRRRDPLTKNLLRIWDAPSQNGDCYALIYDNRIADIQLTSASRHLSNRTIIDEAVSMLAPDKPARGALSQRVIHLLEAGQYSQTAIADNLHMSVATLRRKLTEEGQQFRQLRLQMQNNQARKLLLHSECSLEDIAGQLGFSDRRCFCRAFKALNNGLNPSDFRASMRRENSQH